MFNRHPPQSNNNNLFNPSVYNELSFYNTNNINPCVNPPNENQNIIENNSPFMVVKTNSVRMNFSSQHLAQINNSTSPNFSSPQNHKNYTPSPNINHKEKLSDRFIPIRGTNLIDRFEMTKILNNKEDDVPVNEENQDILSSKESSAQSNKNYTDFLKKNFFGNEKDIFCESNSTNYLSNSNNKTNSNIQSKLFTYKTEEKKKEMSSFSNQKSSPLSLLNNYKIVNTEPERKFSKFPFKILDAPGLMDDFYLNLVDWSNDNDLVVGLHNSVFIWSANKSRVQKLIEYNEENYVSSVAWNLK